MDVALDRDLLPLKRPRREADTTSFIGMAIFLGTWAMLFAGLFFSYALVRYKAEVWPPADEPHLPLALPLANTIVLALSSVTLQLGLRAVREARPQGLQRWLGVTILLGLTFVALQLLLFRGVAAAGLVPRAGIYASVFYALTGFHGLHVLVGLLGLLLLVPGALAGRYTVARHTPVRMWAMFWHFVDGIWLLTFVTLFVL